MRNQTYRSFGKSFFFSYLLRCSCRQCCHCRKNDSFKAQHLKLNRLPRHTFLLAAKLYGIMSLKTFATAMLFFNLARLKLTETCLLAKDELFIWKGIAVNWRSGMTTSGSINLCLLVRTKQSSICDFLFHFILIPDKTCINCDACDGVY